MERMEVDGLSFLEVWTLGLCGRSRRRRRRRLVYAVEQLGINRGR